MKLIQAVGSLEPQFLEIVGNAIDKRHFADVTTAGADVEFSIEHGLGVVPLGYIVIKADKAQAVYESGTAWDTVHIFLKCSAATTALRILIF